MSYLKYEEEIVAKGMITPLVLSLRKSPILNFFLERLQFVVPYFLQRIDSQHQKTRRNEGVFRGLQIVGGS
jgi:hypothetical protein